MDRRRIARVDLGHGGHHHHGHGSDFYFGYSPWWWGGYGYGYGYPYYYPYYSYPSYAYAYPPYSYGYYDDDVYIEPSDSYERSDGYWYYCESKKGYYPTVPECPEDWIKVPPSDVD